MAGRPCRVLPFPHPFRAAVAVCSDIDFTTPERFEAIHRFLNTSEETPFGRGLGLDVADSFWFYNANPEAPEEMSFYAGTSAREKDAAAIRAGWERGWIDALHAYGDFSLAGGFRRDLAARALAAMDRRVTVWINHGDDHNFQNLLERGAYGDVPEKRSADGDVSRPLEYHADLLLAAGVRFVWAGELTRLVGQDRPAGAWEHYAAHADAGTAPAWLAWLVDRAGRIFAFGSAPRKAFRRTVAFLGFPWWSGNDLVRPERLRDGQPVYVFRRLGDFRRDRAEDLDALLSEAVLARLAASGGAAVVFTHLGKTRAGAAGPLPSAAVAAFERLKRFQDEGRIWVVRTSRLLRHVVFRRLLSARREGSTLRLACADDPILGAFRPEEDLATFAVDAGPGAVDAVSFDGRPLAADRWRTVSAGGGCRVLFDGESV